jgi:uncharacterized repeat protein (TIGR03803 family)
MVKEIVMTTRPRFTFRRSLLSFTVATVGLLTALATPALAQTFNVLYAFTGGADGGHPFSGVTVGGPGTLYGTTYTDGTDGWGTVFKLSQRSSGWTLNPLYEFTGESDGANPEASVIVGPNGALYGTTTAGASGGVVFELQPPVAACKTAICYWSETVLHSFTGGADDGRGPGYGNLIFDQAGNIYGTTEEGGPDNYGTAYELSPSSGGWTVSLLHSFNLGLSDGYQPLAGLIFDRAGNLYGTTYLGGTGGGGTAFELSPSGGTWTENILYDFPSNEYFGTPTGPGALIMDRSGNLYGPTYYDGNTDQSTVFGLTPSDGRWIFSTLYIFSGASLPSGPLAVDTAGNLYGTSYFGGVHGYGTVFELTNSRGYWYLTDIYDFTGQSDGRYPLGGLTFDRNGNLYGTTYAGGNVLDCEGYGNFGCGVVWEITGLPDRH